jgi:hypothetical protein
MLVKDLFAETNLVQCVFSWETSNTGWAGGDEYGHHRQPDVLKRYTYRVPTFLQGELGLYDTVVVRCKTGYQVCQVVALNVLSDFDESTFAPVVAKVDMGPYVSEIERAKELKVMKKRIEAEKKRLESMVTYDLIAEKNPEFKALLDAYKAAGGEF